MAPCILFDDDAGVGHARVEGLPQGRIGLGHGGEGSGPNPEAVLPRLVHPLHLHRKAGQAAALALGVVGPAELAGPKEQLAGFDGTLRVRTQRSFVLSLPSPFMTSLPITTPSENLGMQSSMIYRR